MFRNAVLAALEGCGREAIDIGINPTPTAGVVVRRLGAAGAVQITASHNPADQNGVKLLDEQGKMLPPELAEQVRQLYSQPAEICGTQSGKLGQCRSFPMASLWHLQAVQGIVDVEAIRRCNFPVFVDANGGAGGPLAQRLLEELRCRVRGVGLVPDGYFRHPPEPNPENLREVTALVKQSGAVIGFCQDPDADRLVLVDPDRGPLSEEYTLALCLDHVLARRKGPVVINCASSLMNDWIAACHQVALFRVPVGEAHVVRGMMEKQAIFGGEGNGGPIDPRVGWIRDSFVGMALILEALATSGKTLSELVGRLPVFAMQKLKVARPAVPLERIYARLQEAFPSAQSDLADGLRLCWKDRWLICRPSNTEPILRIIAEAPSPQELEQLCQQAQAAIGMPPGG
jgi:phosphomannomutase